MQYDYDANRSWACPGPPGRADVHAPSGRPAVLRAHGRERLPRRHLQRDGVARRPADPRRAGADGAAGGGQDLRVRPHLFRAQRHLLLEQGGQHRAAAHARTSCCSTATTTSRNHHGALFIAGAIPIYLEADRNGFGMVGPIDWAAFDEESIRAKLEASSAPEGHRRLEARASDPGGDHRAVHLRRHRLQRAQGAGEDRPPLRVHPLRRGLGRVRRVPSADGGPLRHGPQADGQGSRASSPRSRRTSSSPASRRPRRSTSATRTSATSPTGSITSASTRCSCCRHRHRRSTRCSPASTSTRRCTRDKAGRVLWDDMVKLGIEARKAVRKRFGGFIDPFVPDEVKYQGKPVQVGGRADRRAGAEQALLAARSRARSGTAIAIWAKTRPWSIRPS